MNTFLSRLLLTAILLILVSAAKADPPKADQILEGRDITWRSIGPGGGGWIQSIAWDPHDPKVLYVGCDVGGFYFSPDAGLHYELRNRGLHDYFVETIAVHPQDSQIILLGTESGIHRTTDQGKNWQWIRKGFPPVQEYAFSAPISSIIFDPQRPNVVYAGIGRPRFDKSGAGAIYRSEDTGLTWRLISAGQLPTDAIVRSIRLQPGRSSTILVTTQHGVYRSDDAGKTWALSSQGLPHRDAEQLAFAPSSPKIVYVSLRTKARDSRPFDGGVFRSDDAGRTWRSVSGPGMPDRVGGHNQSFYMTSQIKDLVVDPRNPDVVYAGGRTWVTAGVYKTEDGGQHWTRVTQPGTQAKKNMDYGWIDFWGPTVESLAISPVNPDKLAFGTSGHVFTSDNGGTTWQQRYCRQTPDGHFAGNGLEVTCVNAVVPDPTQRQRLWVCYADIGLLVSEDNGQTFRRSYRGMKHPGNCFTVVIDPKESDTIWATTGQWTTNQGDICRSTDGGQTWQVVGTPKTGLPDGQVKHLILDPGSPVQQRRLLATSNSNGLFESCDGGLSWQSINGNLPSQALNQPRGLVLDRADPKHFIVALAGIPETGAGIYATRDAGRSWQRINKTSLFANITTLVAAPGDPGILYVGTRKYYDPQTGKIFPGGVFTSRDGGVNWQQVLDFRFVQTVMVSPADPRVIYVGTTDHPYHDDFPAEGLLKSVDGGLNWKCENIGLSLRNVNCLNISPFEPHLLFLGTGGNGVFLGNDGDPTRKTDQR